MKTEKQVRAGLKRLNKQLKKALKKKNHLDAAIRDIQIYTLEWVLEG